MEEKQVEVVDQYGGSLKVFEPLKAEIAKYKEKNANMVFQYETAKGEADARSWCYKLRRTKGKIGEVHKEAKAKALAHCQAVDSEKNWCLGEVEDMVKVHMDPIDAKAKRAAEAKAEATAKLQAEKQAEEDARLKEIEVREAKVLADEQAARTAEIDRKAQIEIEDAKRAEAVRTEHEATRQRIKERMEKVRKDQETIDARNAARDRELAAERLAFEKEKRAEAEARTREKDATEAATKKVKAEAERKEREEEDRLDAIELAKQEEIAKEARRVADEKHRAKVEDFIMENLTHALGDTFTAEQLIAYLKDPQNFILNLQIIY